MKPNIFNSGCQAIVNPVNCIGVMGAGLALAFARRYPEMLPSYVQACKSKTLRPGKFHLYQADDYLVINFPTKDDLSPSKMEYIEKGLITLSAFCTAYSIESIAIPALGCGLGGLDWDEVKPLIEEAFEGHPTKLVLYDPV